MLRFAFMLRLTVIFLTLTIIGYYLHLSEMFVFISLLCFLCAFAITVLSLSVVIFRVVARHKGTPVLGYIVRRTYGWHILGEPEVVLHVITTDGSRVPMKHKINTLQPDIWIFPPEVFCVLYSYKGDLVPGADYGDVDRYFEDEEIQTLGNIVTAELNKELLQDT